MNVLTENRRIVRQGYARQYLRLVRNYIDVGQPQLAMELIQAFNREGVAGEIVAEINDLQRQLNAEPAYIDTSKKMVDKTIEQAIENGRLDDGQIKSLQRFQAEVNEQCKPSNVPRLDAVRRFVNDNTMTATQKASLALSGWILGSNNAIDNLAVTASLNTGKGSRAGIPDIQRRGTPRKNHR